MLDVNALLDAGGADRVIRDITGANNSGQMVGVGLYRAVAAPSC